MEYIARHPESLKIKAQIERLSKTKASIFLWGESGVGKDHAVEFLHFLSGRKGPLIKINSANLSEDLLEAELFGYIRGAFSGADRDKEGKLLLCHRGTLYLDRIENLSLRAQMKIAGALETGVFSPLGSHRQLHSDFRLVVSSSKSPEELEEKSLVDKSFLHICTTFVIHIPPLRKRKEDIIPLVQHFLKKMGAPAAINSRTREKLLSYSWPGNVRELKNIVEREVLIKGELTEDLELPYQLKSLQIQLEELAQKLPTLEELELWYIKKVLDYTRGNRSKAAKILGISRKTLFNKLKKEK